MTIGPVFDASRFVVSSPLPNPVMRVASFGAGVQSTRMLFAAERGEIEPFDAVYFSDLFAEPLAVYEHLRWLRSPNVGLKTPILTVSAGKLKEDVLGSAASWAAIGGADAPRGQWMDALRVANPPFFTRGPLTISKRVILAPMPLFDIGEQEVEIIVERHTERETFGILRRSCTKEYKIEPINAAIRAKLGLADGERGPATPVVELSLGLTTDEMERVATSGVPFIHLRHPLIELGESRGDCVEWFRRNGMPVPPKSRCKFCPFQSDELWLELKTTSPEEFEEACLFDEAIRDGVRGTTTKLYLHSSRTPLRSVDFTKPVGLWSIEGLRNECQGVCGL